MTTVNQSYLFILGLGFLSLFCKPTTVVAQDLSAIYYGTNSPIRTNTIYDIHIAKSGMLYIATDNGFWSYNGLDFKLHQQKGLNTQDVTNIQEKDNGNILFQNFKGDIFCLSNDSLSIYLNSTVLGIALKTYYIAKDYEYYWNNHVMMVKSPQQKEFKSITIDEGFSFTQTNTLNGYILVHTRNKMQRIYRLDKDTIRYEEEVYDRFLFRYKDGYCSIKGSPTAHYKSIIQSGTNDTICNLNDYPLEIVPYRIGNIDSLLIICSTQGLYLPKQKQLYLKNVFITNYKKDREGNLWFSTINKGLCKIPSLKNTVCKTSPQLGKANFILKHEQDLIVSNRVGNLYHWDDKTQDFKNFYKNPIRGATKNIYFSTQINQYIHSGGMTVIFDRDFNVLKTRQAAGGIYPYTKDRVYVMYHSRITLFYLSLITLRSRSRISRQTSYYPSHTLYKTNYHAPNSVSDTLNVLFFDLSNSSSANKFQEWIIGLRHDTLVYIHETHLDSILYYPIPPYSKRLYVSNKRLWVEFDDRLLEYNNLGEVIDSIKNEDYITQNITHISSNDQYIAVSTKTSIIVYDAQTTDFLYKFNHQNGIASVDFDRGWIYNDTLYVNGSSGVSILPLEKQSPPVPPSLTVKAVYANDIKQTNNSFGYTSNNIQIDLNILSFKAKGTLYWRLNGKQWKTLDRPSIDLEALQPGSYTIESYFENDLGTRTTVLTYSFEIRSPFWQTWWFIVILNLVFIGIAGLIWQNRLQARRKEELRQNEINLLKMQALQTQMNPHFIFNVQAAIQGLWLEDDVETALELQNHFSLLLRQIFQYSGQPSITIDQLTDFLEHYLELEKIRFKDSVLIDWEIAPQLYQDDYFIPPLLVQPILENAFKHGLLHKKGTKELHILFEAQFPYFYCKIEDNGVGRRPSKTTIRRASGLKTTQRRLDILQQTVIKTVHPFKNLRVTDLKDEQQQPLGTSVELWIPFVNFSQNNQS